MSRKTILKIAAVVGIAGSLAVAAWLLLQLRPRDAYFEKRRGELASVQVTQDPSRNTAFTSASVHAVSSAGLAVDFRVLRPAAPSGPLPLVVILGGHRTGRDAVNLIGNPGPMVVAALDYPYSGPERPRGIRQSLASIPSIRRGLLDTPPAVALALDWLEAQPWVDRTRIEIVGVSLGGPFAAIAGALDARVKRVWLIHAGSDVRAWITYNLTSRIGNKPARSVAGGLVYALAYGPTFEPSRWAQKISPRPVVVIGAENDERLPPELVRKLHASIPGPKELIWTSGKHVNPDQKEVVRQLLDLVRSRVLAQ